MVLSLGLCTNAQRLEDMGSLHSTCQMVRFGIKGGMNVSNLTSSGKSIKLDSKINCHIGAILEIAVTDRFAIQPEFIYSIQGAKFDQKIEGLKARTDLKLDYITIPIMAKVFLLPNFCVDAGPQISFNVNSKINAEAMGKDETTDISDHIKGYDFSLGLGLGYNIQGVCVSARYNLGVVKVFKHSLKLENINLDEILETKNSRSGVFQLSLGFFF